MSKPFRSDKRKKELLRLKKQEEKRQRRFGAKQGTDESGENEEVSSETLETEGTEDTENSATGEAADEAAVGDKESSKD